MGDSVLTLPNKSVVLALWKNSLEAKAKARSITSEARERVSTQSEIGNLKARAYRFGEQLVALGEKNEIEALDTIDHLRVYLDWAEEVIRSRGHVGDLVKQAEEAEKADAKPTNTGLSPEVALKAFEATAHLAPQPAEEAKTEEKPLDSVDAFRAGLRAIDGGKTEAPKTRKSRTSKTADKYVAEQEKKLGPVETQQKSDLDDDFDALEPPAAPKADPLAGAEGTPTYKMG